MKRVWFHYRRESRLKEDAGKKILQPQGYFIRHGDGSPSLPKKAHDRAIWGLHCPEPDICQTPTPEHNPLVGTIKEGAANGEKLYLLRILSLPSDELYVADTSVFAGIRDETFPKGVNWDSRKGQRLRDEHKKRANPTYDRYWQSLIPFDQYRLGQYAEAEVICFTPIPLWRVKLVRVIDDYYEPPAPMNPDALDELFRDL